MTPKPPTRTLPKVVIKEWPEPTPEFMGIRIVVSSGIPPGALIVATKEQVSDAWSKSLSDFTRVVEETGVLQKETQRRKRASGHD